MDRQARGLDHALRTAPPTASHRSAWGGVLLALLGTAAAALAAVSIARERTTQLQLASMREGLELLAVERDVSLVASRYLTATTMQMYAGGHESEAVKAREAFRSSLRIARTALVADEPSDSWRPIHTDMSTAVRSALATFDEPRNSSEQISWVDEFLYDYKRVIPTDNLGEWTAILEVATWVQEASLVTRDYLDQAMARLWRLEGVAPLDTMLIADFQFSLASMRQIAASHGAAAVSYTPFEEYLDPAAAEAAGPEFAVMVDQLKRHEVVIRIERDMPFLLGLTEERGFESIHGLYAQLELSARDLAAEGERVRAFTENLLIDAVTASEARDARARIGCALAILLTFFLWLRLMQRRRSVERQLRAVAEHDVLTGVSSRYALFSRAPGLLAEPTAGAYALVHLDMDDFKAINDQYGHHIGDAALIAFANACRSCIRSKLDMVARVGGDEFVIMLFQLDDPEYEAQEVIERLWARLEEPVDLGGPVLKLPATAGLAVSREPMALQELLVDADLALLAAKERGRKEVQLFRRSLRRSVMRQLEAAIDNGELRCAFQPQFDMESGSVIGLEALVRWRRPDREHIQALRLIDAILWLGQSMRWLRVAMAQVEEAWHAIGHEFEGRIWVNLAGRDLLDASAEDLLELLAGTETPLNRIGVELTEPVLREDLATAIEKLEQLRAAGVAVALDDVGDDRIPLLHMTELPIDVVKLDRCLVSGIDAHPELTHLVSSLNDLCDRLGLRMLAEGVETVREERVLRELGIRYVQGFGFARPLTVEGLEQLFAEIATERSLPSASVALVG